VLSLDEAEEARPLDRRWIRPLATLTPGTSLHQALAAMRRQGAHLGQVVAKDGTVLGFVALEDVLEELVGEIRDAAHDDEQ